MPNNSVTDIQFAYSPPWERYAYAMLEAGDAVLLSEPPENVDYAHLEDRKTRTEEKSARNAALLSVCDTIPLMMGIAELEPGEDDIRHLYGNAAVADFFRRETDDIEGRLISEIGIPAGIRRLWLAKLRECLHTGRQMTFEYEYQRHISANTSNREWAKITLWPLSLLGDNGQPRFVYLIEDITSYRAAELDLRESRRFLEKIAQTTPSIWYVYDLVAGRNIYANREIFSIAGYSVAEIQEMGPSMLLKVLHPDDIEGTLSHYAAHPYRADGETTTGEFRLRRKDGVYRWLSCHEVPFRRDPETGLVREILGIAVDITQRRETEEALGRSESQLRLAVEGANIGTFVATLDEDMVELSVQARRHLGLSLVQSQITLTEFYALMVEEDRLLFRQTIERAIVERRQIDAEVRILFADRAPLWRGIKAQITFDTPTGAAKRMLGVTFDVGERKRSEAEASAAADRQERIAVTLQSSLLSVAPAAASQSLGEPSDSVFPGWKVGTLYDAALDEAQVGGDFYDAFALTNNKTAFVVGDVAGKGLDAAVSIAEVKFGLRAYLRGVSDDPANALAFLNQRQLDAQVLDGRSRERLIGIAIAVADNRTGAVSIACAGAEPPVLCRRNSPSNAISDASGLPLGAIGDADYVSTTVQLARNETLLLYTDGLTEVRDRSDRDIFGTDGLLRATAAVASADAEESLNVTKFCYDVARTAAEFAGHSIWRDDICLLAARRTI